MLFLLSINLSTDALDTFKINSPGNQLGDYINISILFSCHQYRINLSSVLLYLFDFPVVLISSGWFPIQVIIRSGLAYLFQDLPELARCSHLLDRLKTYFQGYVYCWQSDPKLTPFHCSLLIKKDLVLLHLFPRLRIISLCQGCALLPVCRWKEGFLLMNLTFFHSI